MRWRLRREQPTVYACGCGQRFEGIEALHEHMANRCPNRGRYICGQYVVGVPHGEHFVGDGVQCPGYPEVT